MHNDTFHPHKEVIKAWLEDARIEFRPNSNMDWRDLETYSDVKILPAFVKEWQYRIKKEVKVFRVYTLSTGDVTMIRTTDQYMKKFEKDIQERPYFKKWLTDWISYDA